MDKFISFLKLARTVIRFAVYFFVIIMLIAASQNPEILDMIEWKWWVTFFSLETWYRVTDKLSE